MNADFQFSIPMGWEDRHEKLRYATTRGFAIEIAAFASGLALQDRSVRKTVEADLLSACADFPHPLSYHGAFIDLSLHSHDPHIARVATERIHMDMDTAARLGCSKVIFHTGFNPLVPVAVYEEQFYARHATFWPAVAESYPQITICLENHWEPHPDIFYHLLSGIDHSRVAVCLDVAHAVVYSAVGPEIWVRRLSDRIAHMHWSDNLGDRDAHLTLGLGNICWPAILKAARGLPLRPSIVLELRALDALRASFRYLSPLVRRKAGPDRVRRRATA